MASFPLELEFQGVVSCPALVLSLLEEQPASALNCLAISAVPGVTLFTNWQCVYGDAGISYHNDVLLNPNDFAHKPSGLKCWILWGDRLLRRAGYEPAFTHSIFPSG